MYLMIGAADTLHIYNLEVELDNGYESAELLAIAIRDAVN